MLNVRRYALFAILIAVVAGCASIPEKPTGDYVWPPPPETPRIKWLTQWSSRYDFGRPNPFLTFLLGEDPVERFRRPHGVVADLAGNVYAADSELGLIFVFDLEENGLRLLGEGVLSAPIGLAIDNKRGIIYASDSRADRVFGLDKKNGRVVMAMGGGGEFKNPSGMVFDEKRDRLYLADTQNHIIRVFDKDGKALFTIGKRGNGDGEFNFPTNVALDRNGRLFVTDSFNYRVQILDPDGKFLKKFGKLGDASGYFTRPKGIGVDSEGHVYVVDAAFNNFQIFDEDGKLLLWVGNVGRGPGEFFQPSGMYIDREDRIYISDTFNKRVQVFQYLKEKK